MESKIIRNNNGELVLVNINGFCERLEVIDRDIMKMISPVRCNHCGKTYDLATVKVNHRFADCDQFTTPCCDYKHADTRTWKSFKDFENLDYVKTLKIQKNGRC